MKNKFFLMISLLVTPSVIISVPGIPDPTFGNGTGTVTTNFSVMSQANSVAVQTDGKIVAVGQAGLDFAVARYNTDGTLDTTFNSNGTLAGTITSDFISSTDIAYAVAIQKDGKIIAAGVADLSQIEDFGLAQYTPTGEPDLTFGSEGNGLVTTSFGGNDIARGLAIDIDGKIIAVGQGGSFTDQFAVARYLPDGSLDTSFNSEGPFPGTLTTSLSGMSDIGRAVALQPCDGKIVVVGNAGTSFGIVRYNVNGSIDTSFNQTGFVITSIGSTAQANSVGIQDDGKIVVAGKSDSRITIARYNTDGSLDMTFGTGGLVITVVGASSQAQGVAIQDDGKIIVAGSTDTNFVLVRYNTNGSIDTTFGYNATGIVITEFSIGDSGAYGVALKNNSKIVSAGYADDNFAVAQYLGETLIITKEASSENPCPGQNITYTITAVNNGGGGGTVNGIFIEDVLPQELVFRSYQTSGEASSFDPSTGIWSIPCIRVGHDAQLIIKARVGQFAGNQIICNTAVTTYSSVDNVTGSSLFDELGISNTEIFSTIECVSTLPVIYENINHTLDRTDCGVDDANMVIDQLNARVVTIEAKNSEFNEKLKLSILKLNNVIEIYLSATDCLF